MNNSRSITEGAIFASIYIVLMFITVFVPMLSFFSIFLLPIPFVIYTYRHGVKYASVMFIATLFITIIVATVFSLPTTVMMGMGGIALGWALNEGKGTYEAWARGTIGFSLGLAFVYVITQFVFEINLMEEFQNLIDRSLETSVSLFAQFGQQLDEAQVDLLSQQMHQFLYLIPTFIVLFGVFFAFLTLWISYKIINRLESKNFRFPKFRDFKLPNSLIWYYLVGIILIWIFTDPSETMYLVATNLYTLTGLLLALQGISFAFYFTHYKNWSKAIPIIAIVLLVIYPVFLLYPFRILGIIDLGFQLRERLTKS